MTKKIILKLQVSFFKCNFVCRLVEERCETGEDRVQQLPAIPTGTGTVYTVKLGNLSYTSYNTVLKGQWA